MEEVDAIEDDSIVGDVFMDGLAEIHGVFGPVHGGFYVVADVVTIVPAFMVIFCIDAGDAIFIGIIWFEGADEGVLGPVSHHHNDPGDHKWQDKHDAGSGEIDIGEADTH